MKNISRSFSEFDLVLWKRKIYTEKPEDSHNFVIDVYKYIFKKFYNKIVR